MSKNKKAPKRTNNYIENLFKLDSIVVDAAIPALCGYARINYEPVIFSYSKEYRRNTVDINNMSSYFTNLNNQGKAQKQVLISDIEKYLSYIDSFSKDVTEAYHYWMTMGENKEAAYPLEYFIDKFWNIKTPNWLTWAINCRLYNPPTLTKKANKCSESKNHDKSLTSGTRPPLLDTTNTRYRLYKIAINCIFNPYTKKYGVYPTIQHVWDNLMKHDEINYNKTGAALCINGETNQTNWPAFNRTMREYIKNVQLSNNHA